MARPVLLDLFCGAGGAAMGYYRAGFDVVGVDIAPQPHYPFRFIQADAMEFPLEGYDAIHASPPCQGYSIMRTLPWLREKVYPLLIAPMRERLVSAGGPYVIENVMGAKLAAGWLCGGMFGLPFYRHRSFSTNWFWLQPGHPKHPKHRDTVRNGRPLGSRARDIVHSGITAWVASQPVAYGHASNGARQVGANVGHAAGVALARAAMQIDWMSRDEISQAIPPAYTQYIGQHLKRALEGR